MKAIEKNTITFTNVALTEDKDVWRKASDTMPCLAKFIDWTGNV
jgi:GTP-dependent phosphoenolpyruvate carboxykinase